MRHRASISIMARKGGGVASEGAIAGDLSWLIDDPDRTIADTALALFLTENRWAEPDQEFVLVRADVPAEIYSDLIWTVAAIRSEEHTSELQSLMRISYAVFCLKKKINKQYYKKIKKTNT